MLSNPLASCLLPLPAPSPPPPQDRRIRVYNVDMGWQLRKDVIARNLRWTITDTALSPDQRFLVGSGSW